MNIYVATSWRNALQPEVVKRLRDEGHEAYDFRHPKPGNDGFHWSNIDPDYQRWGMSAFRKALTHKVADEGFALDFEAMEMADACLMVLPCGRSAHLEAGWFVGIGKPLVMLLAPDQEPDLMYKMADYLALSLDEAVTWLQAYQVRNTKRIIMWHTCGLLEEYSELDTERETGELSNCAEMGMSSQGTPCQVFVEVA